MAEQAVSSSGGQEKERGGDWEKQREAGVRGYRGVDDRLMKYHLTGRIGRQDGTL